MRVYPWRMAVSLQWKFVVPSGVSAAKASAAGIWT
jgi:hypothetical protein